MEQFFIERGGGPGSAGLPPSIFDRRREPGGSPALPDPPAGRAIQQKTALTTGVGRT